MAWRWIEEVLGGPLLSVTAVLAVFGAARWLVSKFIEEPGPSRDLVIRGLEVGGLRALYVWLLTRALNWLDRRMGDAGQAHLSWPSPFGNRTPAPFWTGKAIDTCALLAVAYPLLGVVAIWVIAGDAGPIGAVLKLAPDASVLDRVVTCLLGMMSVLAVYYGWRSAGWLGYLWWLATLAVVVIVPIPNAVVFAIALALPFGVALPLHLPVAFAGAVAGVAAVACTVGVAVGGAIAGTAGGASTLAIALTLAGVISLIVVCAVAALSRVADARQRLGTFWGAFGPVALLVALGGLGLASASGGRASHLALIAAFAVLPLVNLPFDFASLGLTRALLRRGCEEDAPSPVLLALADLLLALVLLALLAAALVLAAQIMDGIALRFGDQTFLNLPFLLALIEEEPAASANWWVYFVLFSTLLPSALNLFVGCLSLLCWSMPRHIQARLLETLRAADVTGADNWKGLGGHRLVLEAVLAGQLTIALALTVAGFWALWELGNWTLPWLLPGFLAALRWFATLSGGWFGLPPFG